MKHFEDTCDQDTAVWRRDPDPGSSNCECKRLNTPILNMSASRSHPNLTNHSFLGTHCLLPPEPDPSSNLVLVNWDGEPVKSGEVLLKISYWLKHLLTHSTMNLCSVCSIDFSIVFFLLILTECLLPMQGRDAYQARLPHSALVRRRLPGRPHVRVPSQRHLCLW